MKTFEELGGFEILKKITKSFYDKVYADPWMGLYFKEVKQEHIENQQVDFFRQSICDDKRQMRTQRTLDKKFFLVLDFLLNGNKFFSFTEEI